MLQPDVIRPGLILRVITPHGLGAPLGTLATVKTVETSHSGDWYCTVTYHDKRSSQHRPHLYRSHLWASDLGRFEIVTTMKPEATRARPTVATRIQLRLPFQDGDQNG
jgi:hypothetical protein